MDSLKFIRNINYDNYQNVLNIEGSKSIFQEAETFYYCSRTQKWTSMGKGYLPRLSDEELASGASLWDGLSVFPESICLKEDTLVKKTGVKMRPRFFKLDDEKIKRLNL